MTTGPDDELGDVLRRALHAEADRVVPSADGLDRIRERIGARPPRRFGADWFTANWARPVLAVAAAVAIAAIGVSAPETLRFMEAGGSGTSTQRDGTVNGGGTDGGAPGTHTTTTPTVDPSSSLGTPTVTNAPPTASSTDRPHCPDGQGPATPAPTASPEAAAEGTGSRTPQGGPDCAPAGGSETTPEQPTAEPTEEPTRPTTEPTPDPAPTDPTPTQEQGSSAS